VNEGLNDIFPFAHSANPFTQFGLQFGQVRGAEVAHDRVLEVLPNPVIRVQLWGIGRQPFDTEAPVLAQPVLNPSAAMGRDIVPELSWFSRKWTVGLQELVGIRRYGGVEFSEA